MHFVDTQREREALKAAKPRDVKWCKTINLMTPMEIRMAYLELKKKEGVK